MRTSNYTFLYPKNNLYSKPIKGLQGCGIGYGFSFNGQEKDDEVSGAWNSYDFGARMCDVRLGGRFFSIDPKYKLNVGFSPYSFAANNPILLQDINGEAPGGGGTHFWFFEGSVAIGIGGAFAYIEQSGIAYDRIGKTHFTITTTLYFTNQMLGLTATQAEVYIGAEASLSGGYKYDKRSSFSSTIGDVRSLGSGTDINIKTPKIRGKLGIGLETDFKYSFSVTLGLGIGAGLKYASDNVKGSISLTDCQAEVVNKCSDVFTEAWKVINSQAVKNEGGEITGYIGRVATFNKDGKMVNTGVTVYSGVTKDSSGNTTSNNTWSSKEYSDAANSASKEEIK